MYYINGWMIGCTAIKTWDRWCSWKKFERTAKKGMDPLCIHSLSGKIAGDGAQKSNFPLRRPAAGRQIRLRCCPPVQRCHPTPATSSGTGKGRRQTGSCVQWQTCAAKGRASWCAVDASVQFTDAFIHFCSLIRFRYSVHLHLISLQCVFKSG